jgi:hypothetical protein
MTSEKRIHKIAGVICVLLLVALFAYNFNHGERIQYQDGLGWDGAAYADWAQKPSCNVVTSGKISAYYVGRLLPSLVVHNASQLFGYDIHSAPRVIHAFYIYNFALLLLSGCFLFLIGRHLKWNFTTYFLGGAALFVNYPILKNASYNPTLVDVSGFTISLAVFYFYLREKIVPLVICIVMGAFIWPTLLYGAIPMLALGNAPFDSRRIRPSAHALAALIPVLTMALVAKLYFIEGLRQTPGTTPIRMALLPLSIVLLMGYMYFATRPFADVPAWLAALKQSRWQRILLAAVTFAGVKLIIGRLAAPDGDPLTITSYIGLLTQASLANPLVNVVAHAMHYGPFYLLVIFLWPQVCAVAKEHGAGLVFCVALFAALSIGSESRQFINAWPLFAVLVCEVLRRKMRNDSWFFVYGMILLAATLSRFWLSINVGPWTGDFQHFPEQMLFMYSGPWMSDQMYEVFVAVTLISAVAVVSLLKNINQRVPAAIDTRSTEQL